MQLKKLASLITKLLDGSLLPLSQRPILRWLVSKPFATSYCERFRASRRVLRRNIKFSPFFYKILDKFVRKVLTKTKMSATINHKRHICLNFDKVGAKK